MDIKFTNTSKKEPLRIIKKLPQIILPADKNELFLKWYDDDLRFQDEIPKAFDRGYIFMENNFFNGENMLSYPRFRKHLTCMAKIKETSYRNIEKIFYNFLDFTKNTIAYFEFKNDFFIFDIYINNILFNEITVDLTSTDKSLPNPKCTELLELMINNGSEFSDMYAYMCFIFCECCLWYIATASNRTKYYRENNQQPFYYEKKEIFNIKKNKYITTPVYDMNKIRKVKVDSLIKRRKGWTYSHSFQVHGHYRHYADGKVIFINSYIKGKGKEEMAQVITLNPKELK